MLKVEKLTKYYGDIKGVANVNLDVKKGEIYGFIGPNGAGKSTTIRLILDILKPDNGKILVDNKETYHNYELKYDIGYLPSEVNLYSEMKVSEMLDYNKSFYSKDISEKTEYLVKKLKLDETKVIEELSFGNLKKLGIILALAHEPKLIILDEPTSGLDPIMQEVFFEILKEEQKRGATVFFSSHVLSEVRKVCNRIAIIKDGSIVKVEEIKKRNKNNFNVVTLVSKDYKKLKLPIKDIAIIEKGDNFIKFVFKKSVNELLNIINEVKIDNLLIEEPSLEDEFMNYYK